MNRILIVIFLSLLFYVVFMAFSDFSKISKIVSDFKFELIPIILLFTFSGFLAMGVRQFFLLKKIGIHLSIKENIKLYLSGLSMIITPGGSGQLIKSYYLKKKYNYEIQKTLPLVFVERFIDLICITTLIAFSILFIFNVEIIITVIIIYSLILIGLLTLRFKKLFNICIRILTKISFLQKFVEDINNAHDSLYKMTSTKPLLIGFSFGMISFSFEAIATFFVFVAFDVNLDFFKIVASVYPPILYGALSFIPAGVGVTELNAVRLLTAEGISTSLSSAIILMTRFLTIWFATIIGFIATKLFLKNN